MKVVHLISGGDIGGAKTHIESLLPKLNNTGDLSVHLLCVMEGALTAECRKLGVPVKVIPQKKRYDLTIIKKMANWLKAEKFDIVHCHGARANFIAFFLRFYVNIPMLTTIHSDYRLDFKGGGYRRWLYTPLNVFSLKQFKHFITVSGVLRDMMIERGFNGRLIDVVYNGTDFDSPIPSYNRNEFLSKHGISCPEGAVIIGCVARLHPVKGADILLKAAKLIFERGVNAIVLIAGDGEEREGLTRYIEKNGMADKARLLGFIKEIDAFYAAIDINVVPSISEGFSLAVIEGARHKLDTAASRTGGIPEIITDGGLGTLFEPGDYNALAEILQNAANNPSAGGERGERLYESVKQRFSVKKMAERHLEIYNKICAKEGENK